MELACRWADRCVCLAPMALLATASASVMPHVVVPPTTFVFIGERLWLDFVNTDDLRRGVRVDVIRDFDSLIQWLGAVGVLDAERASGISRRAEQQPAGAAAALVDARRVRAALKALAERGAVLEKARADALIEINRVLG